MTNYRQLPFRQKFWYGSLPASLQDWPLNTVLARVPKIKIHNVVSVAARAKNHSGVTRQRGSTLRMNMWFTSDLGKFDKHKTSFFIFRWQGLQCSIMTSWPKMPEITQQKIKAHLWIAIVSKPFFATLHHSIYAAYTASIPLYKHIQTITTCIQSRIYTNHQRCTKMIRKLKPTMRESNHMRIGLLDPTICLLRSRWSQILATAPMHHKIKRKENTSAEDST